MASFDRCRRAASVALVMACLVLVPSVALAQFRSTKAPTLSVGTDTMDALTAVTGTYACTKAGGQTPTETITFTVTGFTDTGPLGSTYTFTILKAGVVKATGTSLTHTKVLAWTEANDNAATTWTLTIWAGLSSWTGPLVTKSGPCTVAANNSGNL